MIANWRTQIIRYNIIGLSILSVYQLIRSHQTGTFENYIYWPFGYFISLALISTFLIQFKQIESDLRNIKGVINTLMYALLFGASLLILSDLLIIIFERFFRVEEHYQFGELPSIWVSKWHLILEGVIIYFGYIILIKGYANTLQNREANTKLKELQDQLDSLHLAAMKNQLNPHFLYNAMNSIAMTIRIKEYKKAIDMIVNLNELLRVVLKQEEDQLITVENEIDLLNKYLNIETLRFGDHVKINLEVSEKVLRYRVPQLIIQPIVENAFKHGMSDNLDQQQLRITVEQENNWVLIKVFNTLSSRLNRSNLISKRGIGLQNTTHRLRKLYGNEFKFQQEILEEGLEFRILIPAKYED